MDKIGKIITATYQIQNYSDEERGYNLQVELKNVPDSIEFNQIVFRNKVAKNLTLKTQKKKANITTYLPLVSRKLKTYQQTKSQKPDGIFYTVNKKTYFYPLNFKIKI